MEQLAAHEVKAFSLDHFALDFPADSYYSATVYAVSDGGAANFGGFVIMGNDTQAYGYLGKQGHVYHDKVFCNCGF
jgi:hypothetical protein